MKASEQAIEELDAKIVELGTPVAGSADWFLMLALVTGRSMLKGIIAAKVAEDPLRSQTHYRECRKRTAIYTNGIDG